MRNDILRFARSDRFVPATVSKEEAHRHNENDSFWPIASFRCCAATKLGRSRSQAEIKGQGGSASLVANDPLLTSFRVPERGSGNPTPLGGPGCPDSGIKRLDGSVQAWQPHHLGLQVSPGLGDKVSLWHSWWRHRNAVPGNTA